MEETTVSAISVPFSEIRKKARSLGLTEEQFTAYLGFYFSAENEIGEDSIQTTAKLVYHPTKEKLLEEEEYVRKLVEKGYPNDYQDYLGETLFSRVEEWLGMNK